MSQYSGHGIRRYERIFGPGFVSPGGLPVTAELAWLLKLQPGARVLDVGSGLGGAALHLADRYRAVVVGVDLSHEMLEAAGARARAAGVAGVSFVRGDITWLEFRAGCFDVVWSRDSLLHVADKPALFARLRRSLAPAGQVLITDYARSPAEPARGFAEYVAASGYHLLDLDSYGAALAAAGFDGVVVEDRTEQFAAILQSEMAALEAERASFLKDFAVADLDYLRDRWSMKLDFCRRGDLKWGLFRVERGCSRTVGLAS